MSRVRTVGVEEELFLVDPQSCRILPVSSKALRADGRSENSSEELEQELFLPQIEVNTEPTTDLRELRDHIVGGRARAAEAATAAGAAILASPTTLFAEDGAEVTPKPRYQKMLQLYGEVGRRGYVCGMHVHVEVADQEEGVRILDRIQPWLPVITALAANSPFHDDRDTGYASWRQQIWDGWPTSGPVEPFGDAAGYHAAVERLVESGAALDTAMVYFDARLAQNYPTVEIRVADVCTEVDDALLIAALTRALVETAAHDADPTQPWRVEMLRAGRWMARRHGLSGELIDPRTQRRRAAADVVDQLFDHVDERLRAADHRDEAIACVDRLMREGGGAGRQRVIAGAGLDLAAVGRDLLERTRLG